MKSNFDFQKTRDLCCCTATESSQPCRILYQSTPAAPLGRFWWIFSSSSPPLISSRNVFKCRNWHAYSIIHVYIPLSLFHRLFSLSFNSFGPNVHEPSLSFQLWNFPYAIQLLIAITTGYIERRILSTQSNVPFKHMYIYVVGPKVDFMQ
jgi:hypothetical protein